MGRNSRDGAVSTRFLLAAVLVPLLGGCSTLVGPRPKESLTPVLPAARLSPTEEVEMLLEPSLSLASAGDAVVRLVGPQLTCSGTLIDEDLVLTAHHCVVEREEAGGYTRRLVASSSLQIELGGDYLPWGNVGVSAILAPPCGETGGAGDIAVLVLERKLVGVATMTLRKAPPKAGDLVDPIGFGRCALSPQGIVRRQREGGRVGAISRTTFEVQASVCPGDSGGPAIDRRTREVVGVVSLSAMDHDEATRARSVFARVDGVASLAAYARAMADGAELGDLPPLNCER
jgi:hypothetical protein